MKTTKTPEDVLAHFGVLGMKWGVRKDRMSDSSNTSKQESKSLKVADKEWLKRNNRKALIKSSIEKVDADKSFQTASRNTFTILQRIAPNQTVLMNSYQTSMAKHIDNMWANDPSSYNPSNTKRISMKTFEMDGETYLSPTVIKTSGLKHATTDENEELELYYRVTKSGKIEQVDLRKDKSKTPEDVLAHFGILGMKWGVRRQTGSGGTVSETSAASRGKASRLKEKAEASSDYTKSRELKRKAAKTLSNVEIKALNERLQLEQSLSRLNPSTLKKGENFVKGALAVGTTASAIYGLAKRPVGEAVKKAIGTAVKKVTSGG